MKAIIGLGNPGPRYRHTRHNAGWQVLDEMARRWRGGTPVKTRQAEVLRCAVDGETVLLVKPLTFMNDSGKVARALVEKEGLTPPEMLIVYDDIDLAQGRLRVRAGGSAGGHNGIKSIQRHFAQVMMGRKSTKEDGSVGPSARPEFPRIKIGLGRPPAGVDPIDYVLSSFSPDEEMVIGPAIQRAAAAAECWLRDGIEVAMNRFNGPAVSA